MCHPAVVSDAAVAPITPFLIAQNDQNCAAFVGVRPLEAVRLVGARGEETGTAKRADMHAGGDDRSPGAHVRQVAMPTVAYPVLNPVGEDVDRREGVEVRIPQDDLGVVGDCCVVDAVS